MRPLDWVQSVSQAALHAVPHLQNGADGPLDWVPPAEKSELRPGDHIYAWKMGFTYSHHGVVVHTQDCAPDCAHDRIACCSVVHFRPPSGDERGAIEVVSLADFGQCRGICHCRYGVPSAEFYIRRSGSCSTQAADPWPLTVIRALSLLEWESLAVGEASEASLVQVEYNLLRKNSELLACWCKLGSASGVRRFRSEEMAFSNQSSPGRFVRLGLATAGAVALVAGATIAVGAATGGAAAGGAAASGGAAAGEAAAGGAAAAEAAVAAGLGGLAASASAVAARMAASSAAATAASSAVVRSASSVALAVGRQAGMELVADIARRPSYAVGVMEQLRQALPAVQLPAFGTSAPASRRSRSFDEERRRHEEQQAAIVVAMRSTLDHMEARVPKELGVVLDDPMASCRLCEILVDVIEEAGPKEARGCTVVIESFLDGLRG